MRVYIIPQMTSTILLPSRMLCNSGTPQVTGGNVDLENKGNQTSQAAAF